MWDGFHFAAIAGNGYDSRDGVSPDHAWYPGYPAVVRAASLLTGGDPAIMAVLMSNATMFLALVALYALSVRHLEPARAIWSLWFLCLAPGAIAFTLSYSESLFLFLATSAFLAAENRHHWLAGVALMFATLTRAPGVLLVIPLWITIIDHDGWRPSRSWLPLALGPLALVGWFSYLWVRTGDFFATVTAQSYWDVPAPLPDDPIISHLSTAVFYTYMAILIFYVFLFVFFRHDRIRPAYWVVSGMAVLSVFLAGRWFSLPRYLAVAWPFDWVLARRESRVGKVAVLATFACVQVAFSWLAFTWLLSP